METTALSFARPEWLHALWLLPLGVALFWWAERRRRAMIGRIVAPKLRAVLAGNTSPFRRWFRSACVLGALGLLVVSLAGPRAGYDSLEVPHRGRDVIIAMDVSRSMLATDVAPTRLQRAKLLAEDLIAELGGDRVGLIAFAGTAFLQAPLTLDHGAVLAAVDELDTDLIPRGGTNIEAAIRTSEEAFGKAEGFSRAIVIISDGEELDQDGVAAARQAADHGIRIFTVGVGSEEGSEIPLPSGDFVRDSSGKLVVTRLDVERMKEIAGVTGGFYLPLDESTARRLVADGIGKLEEVEMATNTSRRPIERYQWPLAAALVLLVLQALVGERRHRPPAALAAALLLAVMAPDGRASGVEAYQQGDYREAQRQFEERLKLEPTAPNLLLNAGTAAYRLHDYNKAAEYFSRAMLSDDPALRSSAEFNLGNTLFRQGEARTDKATRIVDWKDAIAKYEAALKTRADYTEARENKERVEELLRQEEQEQEDQQQDQQDQQDQQQDQQKNEDQQQQDQNQQQQDQQQSGGGKQDEQDQQGRDQKDQQSGGDQKDEQDKPEKDEGEQGEGGEGRQDQPQDGEGKKDEGSQGQEEQDQEGQPDKQGDQDRGEGEDKKDESEGQQGDEPRDGDEGQSEPQDDGRREGPKSDPGRPGEKPAPVPEQSGERKEGELRGADGAEAGQQEQAQAAGDMADEEVEGRMSEAQARALLRSLQSEEEQVDLRERRPYQEVLRDW